MSFNYVSAFNLFTVFHQDPADLTIQRSDSISVINNENIYIPHVPSSQNDLSGILGKQSMTDTGYDQRAWNTRKYNIA